MNNCGCIFKHSAFDANISKYLFFIFSRWMSLLNSLIPSEDVEVEVLKVTKDPYSILLYRISFLHSDTDRSSTIIEFLVCLTNSFSDNSIRT